MTICMNGNNRDIPQASTLESLIDLHRLNKDSVVIELNHRVIARTVYGATRLHQDDVVEIVQFVGGG